MTFPFTYEQARDAVVLVAAVLLAWSLVSLLVGLVVGPCMALKGDTDGVHEGRYFDHQGWLAEVIVAAPPRCPNEADVCRPGS